MEGSYEQLKGKLEPEHLEKLKALESRTTKIFSYCIKEASERMNREDSSPLDVYQLLQYALKASSLPFPTSDKLRAVCLNNLGAFYHSLGDYQAAHPCLLDAVKLNQRNQAVNGKDLQLAKMHLNLGTTLLALGKYKLGLRYSQRAWLLLQQQMTDSTATAPSESDYGVDEEKFGSSERPETADSARQRSLANPVVLTADSASRTERLALIVECTHRVALCHEKLKDFRDALLWYGESVKRAQTLLSENHPVLAMLQQAETNAARELRRFELRFRRKQKEKKQDKIKGKWGPVKSVGTTVALSPALRELQTQRAKHERALARQLANASAGIRARKGSGPPARISAPPRKRAGGGKVRARPRNEPAMDVSQRAVELYTPVKPSQPISPSGNSAPMRSPKTNAYERQSASNVHTTPLKPTGSRPHSAEVPSARPSSYNNKISRRFKSSEYS